MTGVDVFDSRTARARIIRKITVALVTGTFAYVVTELTNQPSLWSLTLSVFIGGVTLVVQFLIDFETRLARVETGSREHSARIEEMVQSGFSKINEVTELFSLVEASALPTDAVTQLVRHSSQIGPGSARLVFRFAQAEIARTSDFLKDLSEGGNVIYEGEDRDWMLALTRNTEHSIDATSLTTVDAGGRGYVDGGLWTRDLGQRYLELQREAVQRGVRVRRIFVVVHPIDRAVDGDVLRVCRPQQELGIHVRVLDSGDIPSAHRDAMFDFVLFDEVISYEVTPTAQVDTSARPTIQNTRLELRQERVRSRIQRFEQLWEAARDVDRLGLGPSPVTP